MNIEELEKKHKIGPDDIDDGFTMLNKRKSLLDGRYLADDLRRIADAMDEWKKGE